MLRRRYLAFAGTVALPTVAGCGSNGDPGSEPAGTDSPSHEPADIEVVSLSAPGNTEVGTEATVEVTAENTGGTTGSYEDRLVVAEGNSEFSADVLLTVEPGQRATEVYTFRPQFADEYVIELERSGVSTTIATDPVTYAVGETVPISGDLEATLRSVELRDSLFYEAETTSIGSPDRVDPAVLDAPSDRSLVLLRLRLENVGTGEVSFDRSLLSLGDGTFYEGLPRGEPIGNATIEGKPLNRTTLEPSQIAEGWLLGQVTDTETEGGFEVLVQRDTRRTPAEATWDVPAGRLEPTPEFELASVDAPATSRANQSYELTLTVKNTADVAGTFRGVLEYEGSDDWLRLRTASRSRFETAFDAGERRTFTVTNESAETGTFTYQLSPLANQWQTTFE